MENYKLVASLFTKLAKQESNPYKARAFSNFARLTEELKSVDADLLRAQKGVGDSCINILNEYLETGKCSRLVEELPELNKQNSNNSSLYDISGLGESRISKLLDAGYNTAEDIINLGLQEGDLIPFTDIVITHQIYIGMKFMAHTDKNRMSWGVADSVVTELVDKLSTISGLDITPVGSYRRKSDTVGDIDIVVVDNDNLIVPDALTLISNTLDEVVSIGETKIQGIYNSRQVDIRIVPKEYKWATILYFTGPRDFNIHMRIQANKLGCKLSEYGVIDSEGNRLDDPNAIDETSLFTAINLEYTKPEFRK